MSIFKTALTFSAAAYIVSLGLSSIVVSSDDADAEDFVYSPDLAVALGRANVPIYWSSGHQEAQKICDDKGFTGFTTDEKLGELGDGNSPYIVVCDEVVKNVDMFLSLIRHEAVHVAQYCYAANGFVPLGLKQEDISDHARRMATTKYYPKEDIPIELEAYTIEQWSEDRVSRLVDDHCNNQR